MTFSQCIKPMDFQSIVFELAQAPELFYRVDISLKHSLASVPSLGKIKIGNRQISINRTASPLPIWCRMP